MSEVRRGRQDPARFGGRAPGGPQRRPPRPGRPPIRWAPDAAGALVGAGFGVVVALGITAESRGALRAAG
ncbi:MAG TPA: hypothetical protein VFH45_09780, partial [Acidimicrobiales bacterium]|nr:hypothetical protein [Acidimicrobiales bacterium]